MVKGSDHYFVSAKLKNKNKWTFLERHEVKVATKKITEKLEKKKIYNWE